MPTMGRYCKAYRLKVLRDFSHWSEKLENARQEKRIEDGQEAEGHRVLSDASHLYLQENYVVTDGIFKDENIIFDDVTPEWMEYCRTILKFQSPVNDPRTNL